MYNMVVAYVLVQVLGSGQMGMVVRVKCTKTGHPKPDKSYALKVVFNFGATTYSLVRILYTAEYEAVSSLKRHPNIVPYWGQFRDVVPQSVCVKVHFFVFLCVFLCFGCL